MPAAPPPSATENSLTRRLSPPRKATPTRSKIQKAILEPRDDSYGDQQDEAGMRWTKRSGFNTNQIQDFQMLLELIKPIMIKPDQISGSREIAQGSFGTIYSAVFNRRNVAVKRINKVFCKNVCVHFVRDYFFTEKNPNRYLFRVSVIGICEPGLLKEY